MGFRIGPGPNCCDTTTATCDDLATDDLANYTQVSGTWTKPGTIIQTTDANALLVFNTPQPDGEPYGRVSFNLTLPDSGEVRLILGYQDANNYLFLEVEEIGATFYDVWIGHRTGGADVYLEGAGRFSGLGSNNRFDLCYNGDRLSAFYQAGSTGLDAPLTGTWGSKFAIQTINITGTPGFHTAVFYPINGGESGDECTGCSPACQFCDSSARGLLIPLTPVDLQLYLTGVANSGCANCVALFEGATFLLENPGPIAPDPGGWATRTCCFEAASPGCSGLGSPTIRFCFGETLTPTTSGVLLINNPDGGFTFTRNTNRCDEIITVVGGNNGFGGLQQCDWTATTATITPNIVD